MNVFSKISQIALLALGYCTAAYAQHPGPRSFEVTGLPDGNEIMETLPAGIGFLILGIILVAIAVSHKKDDGSPSDDPVDKIKFGCGCASLIAAAVCLLPLLAWIEFGFVTSISVMAALCVAFLVLHWIYEQFKGK